MDLYFTQSSLQRYSVDNKKSCHVQWQDFCFWRWFSVSAGTLCYNIQTQTDIIGSVIKQRGRKIAFSGIRQDGYHRFAFA